MSKSDENVVPLVGKMLRCMENRGPDGAGLVAGGRIIRGISIDDLQSDLQEIKAATALGHTRLAIVGGTCGTQPFISCDGRFALEHNGEIYNYKMLRERLEKRHKFATMTDSEVIVHLLEEHAKTNDLLGSIRRTVEELDGVYAIAVRDERTGEVALVRDRIGVRQLYFAETPSYVAFASERKALWKIGISGATRRVMPSSALIISPSGQPQSFRVMDPIPTDVGVTYTTMDPAMAAYSAALQESMVKRAGDLERVGIIFSGGIDSLLIAHLATKIIPEVVCYTCGVQVSNDLTNARSAAEKLNLKLRVCELDQEDVEQLIPEIIDVIEDSNAGQIEVALPVYAAVRLAHQDGIRVMFTGQGADELFGGYSWYPKIAEKEGYAKLRDHMVQDLLMLHKETLEREDKITMAHSIELREPFLDPGLIRVALGTDLRLNVKDGRDRFGKRVHREVAHLLGIPTDLAYRVKEAAQHGSGMHGTLDAIARKNGFEETSIPGTYLDAIKSRERIGSSQRYGYLFVDEKIWTTEPHVQMYIDGVAEYPVRPILAPTRKLR
ncbi:MAG: asparagine synthetase B family protein [Nitrososphaera sp.]